jgi:hypothetical protein
MRTVASRLEAADNMVVTIDLSFKVALVAGGEKE